MPKRKAAVYDEDEFLLPTLASSAYSSYGSSYAPGSSSNPIVLDSPPASKTKAPPAKRQRKAKDPDAPKPEKRLARYKASCPQNIKDRLERVTMQRFFMIDRQREDGQLREEFKVLGSTGNVYTVVIDKLPSCNCPDAMKGNHCKHILFIFAKVLQVPYESHIWFQKALLTSELEEVFNNAPLAPNDQANPRVREAYARATGKAPQTSSSQSNRRVPDEESDCPICYESMHKAKESTLSFCDTCGNCLHKECFSQWARSKGSNVTCPMCRAKWITPATAGGSRGQTSEGYINLASAAGVSPARDTSTYYHGPRRGYRHYGYQCYDDDPY